MGAGHIFLVSQFRIRSSRREDFQVEYALGTRNANDPNALAYQGLVAALHVNVRFLTLVLPHNVVRGLIKTIGVC